MRKLSLLTLAATVAFPTVALAQVAHPGPPPGHMVHGGSSMGHHGGRFMHPGRDFPHRRLHRGFVIHPFWFGPQFHIQNWQMYGFAAPPPDHRWVRYYDDAYLVDRDGRVMDERYGLDWDEYGERWEMADGIPSYYGRGDYRPDEEDHAWVERRGGWDYSGYGYGEGHGAGGRGHGPPPPGCQPASHPCGNGGGYGGGYGYGGGHGYYGYGVAYPIIIETTVWGGTTYYEEVTEEVVEVRQRQRRHYRPPPCPRPRPRPPAGERG